MRVSTSLAFATALSLNAAAHATAGTRLSGLSRCGPLAMQICASICGTAIGGDEIDAHIEGDADGCTLLELKRVAELLGLSTFAAKYPRGLPYHVGVPAVLPVVNAESRRHFVALAGRRGDRALVVDLPSGLVWLTENQLRHDLQWDGEALHVAADGESIQRLVAEIEAARTDRCESRLLKASAIFAILALSFGIASQRRTWRRAAPARHA